jgi:glycosyltransferase involved in cell wall biosynthesis
MNRRIRILFAIDSVNAEAGTENQVAAMIRGIDRQRFEVFMACLEDAVPSRHPALQTSPLIFPMKSIFSFRGLRNILRLRGQINRLNIDIVHTFVVRSTILGVLAACGSTCEVILTSRRNLGDWYTPFYLFVFRILNRLTSRVVANSEAAKQAAITVEGLPASRIDVLYNGVDLAKYSGTGDPNLLDQLGIPRRSRIVGIVANYRPVKDLPMFLRAASIIAARHADAVFLLVGQGPLRQSMEDLAEQLRIRGKVFFTNGAGSVSGYLPLLEVGCLSSLNEGFSNSILEYMAAGLAVVATDVGGNREAIVEGVTGFLTPAGDEKNFAERVITLLEDADLRKTMGENGHARCEKYFSMETCVAHYEHYYESLPKRGPQ